VDRAYLAQAGELGWFAALVPEDRGGGSVSGHGLADAAVIATERGRSLQPGPFIPMNVVADLLAGAGPGEQLDEVLPALASGRTIVTWAVGDPSGEWEPGRAVGWSARAGRYYLRGVAGLVQDAGSADWLLVTAGSDSGISNFLIPRESPGVAVQRLDGLDVTRHFYEVRFDDVEVESSALVGPAGGGRDLAERGLDVAAVLTVAEMVGAMDQDFEMALEYAKNRIAFGRPIGSFQAVKHLLAETSLLIEASKAALQAAVTAVEDDGDGSRMASVAKAYAGESGIDVVQNCFQTFGGIGFTWEHDQHLYLRRVTTDAAIYGDAAWHRDRLWKLYGMKAVAG
jgi:alkylation response protein AidB-like acyl-CoA dehydrogenase